MLSIREGAGASASCAVFFFLLLGSFGSVLSAVLRSGSNWPLKLPRIGLNRSGVTDCARAAEIASSSSAADTTRRSGAGRQTPNPPQLRLARTRRTDTIELPLAA